jgi:Family of unknown function (DUF5995)
MYAEGATSIPLVLQRMDALIERSRALQSRRGYFACLYRGVTARVQLDVKRGFFQDGPRMERLVVRFAGYYLSAVDDWEAGRRPSRCWKYAFEQEGREDLIILQHLLLGMNAHINLDLAVSAADVAPGSRIQAMEEDFRRINDVLVDLIDRTQAAIDRCSPGFDRLDRGLGSLDEGLGDFSIRKARAQAWTNARHLAASPPALRALGRQWLDAQARAYGGLLVAATPLVQGLRRHELDHIQSGGVTQVIDVLRAVDIRPR